MVTLAVGDRVTLFGLQGRADLNGRDGKVVSALDASTGRVGVKVDGEAKVKALKAANLAPVPISSAATGGASVKPPVAPKLPKVGRQAFTHNGQTVYEWEQNLDEVKIYIKPPPGLPASEIEINIQQHELSVGLRGAERPFLHERFPSVVKVVDSTWMLDEGEIEILLQKMRKAEMWPSALVGHGEMDQFTKEQVQKSMMLERFGEENPGFDFSGAEFSGSCPDPRKFMGGVKHQRR